MAKLKDGKTEIVVSIKFITDISLWNALKLRLAGGEAIKKSIDAKMEESKAKEEIL